jgi:hypothetical protein
VVRENGNHVERFLSGYLLSSTPEAEELAVLVRGSLSRRLHRHDHGFATHQHQEWERDRASAKKLLDVLRTVLTGVHVLGERHLPVESPNASELEGWLVETRPRWLGHDRPHPVRD